MPASSVIIGIHGLANKPPREEKSQWWKAALIEGLQRNCKKTTDELSFDFVYWADLRYKEGPISEADNPEPYWPVKSHIGPFPAYHTHKWDLIINSASALFGRELDFLERHTGVSRVADFVLQSEREAADLEAYYDNMEFKEEVRSLLSEKIREHKGKRIMLIAHSMGSIIAYDTLRVLGRDGPQLRVDHFITIGSPLGLPYVKGQISRENDLVRTPSIVGRWTNFADRRDVVALDARLSDDYEPNDQGIKVADVPVINAYCSPDDRNPPNKPNYHKSYGYLRTPELSELVRAFV
jgi:hypothetical protein